MTFETINRAWEILRLPEYATMDQIKDQYRTLIKQWHPDRCNEAPEKCEEMTRHITEAYQVIINYCNSYRYSFKRDEVEKHLSEDELWRQRFGSDPIWGA